MRMYTEAEACEAFGKIRDHWCDGEVDGLYRFAPREAMQRIETASKNAEHFAMTNFVPNDVYCEFQEELGELMDEHRHRRGA